MTSDSDKINNFLFIYFFLLTLFFFIYLSFILYSNSNIQTNVINLLLAIIVLFLAGIYYTSTFSLSQKIFANFFSIQSLYSIIFYLIIFLFLSIIVLAFALHDFDIFQIKSLIKYLITLPIFSNFVTYALIALVAIFLILFIVIMPLYSTSVYNNYNFLIATISILTIFGFISCFYFGIIGANFLFNNFNAFNLFINDNYYVLIGLILLVMGLNLTYIILGLNYLNSGILLITYICGILGMLFLLYLFTKSIFGFIILAIFLSAIIIIEIFSKYVNLNYDVTGTMFFGILFLLSVGYFILNLLKIPNLVNFLTSSKLLFIILYIIFLSYLFTYYSGDLFSKYPFAFETIYALITGFLFYWSLNSSLPFLYNPFSKIINPYFERPHKISLLICFLFILLQLYIYNPGNIISSFGEQSILYFFLFGLFILINILVYFFVPKENINIYTKSINVLFLLAAFVVFILWMIYIFSNFSSNFDSNWFKSWTSILLIIFIFILFVKILYDTYKAQFIYGNKQKSAMFDLFIQSILYVPCLISDSFNYFGSLLEKIGIPNPFSYTNAKSFASYTYNDIKSTPTVMWFGFIIGTILMIVYLFSSTIYKSAYNTAFSKATLLINDPKPLNESINIGTFQNLELMSNDSSNELNYNYKYGISLWFYIDALSPTTNAYYSTYSPIFNYGNKPLIEYNSINNSIRIKMGSNKSEGSKIVYEGSNVKLQKWINLVINYDGGTVDVFMDGKLLKSTENVVPYMNMDAIILGANNGIYGKICNVSYASQPFTLTDIYYMRKLVETKNPPVL